MRDVVPDFEDERVGDRVGDIVREGLRVRDLVKDGVRVKDGVADAVPLGVVVSVGVSLVVCSRAGAISRRSRRVAPREGAIPPLLRMPGHHRAILNY